MDFAQKVIAAILAAGVVALITYVLRLRLLCVINRYFQFSSVSSRGITVVTTILNRGHLAESEIRVELDPKFQYSLLARSTASLTLSENEIRVDRLAKLADVTAILLVEGGEFSDRHVLEVSSKDAKGKVYATLEKAPSPPGVAVFAFAFLLLGLVINGWLGYQVLTQVNADKEEPAVGALDPVLVAKKTAWEKLGWANLDGFLGTTLAAYYDASEFPVRIESKPNTGGVANFEVTLLNNTSGYMLVTIYLGGAGSPHPTFTVPSSISDKVVPAGESMTLKMGVIREPGMRAINVSGHVKSTVGDTFYLDRIIELPKDN